MLNHPTRHRAPTSTGRCSNCGDVLPPGQPVGRIYCAPCCYPAVRKLRRRAPRQVRP